MIKIMFLNTLRYERTDSQVLMLRTLFRRKCGSSDLRARRNDVRCEKSLAYKKRCLNVRSATASKKKNSVDSTQRSMSAITIKARSL